jgi:hypothetical protein
VKAERVVEEAILEDEPDSCQHCQPIVDAMCTEIMKQQAEITKLKRIAWDLAQLAVQNTKFPKKRQQDWLNMFKKELLL